MPGFNGPPVKYPIQRVRYAGGDSVYHCGNARLLSAEAMPVFVRPIIAWCDQHQVPLASHAVASLDDGTYWRFTFGLNSGPEDTWYVLEPEGVNDLIDRIDWSAMYHRLTRRVPDKTPDPKDDQYWVAHPTYGGY